MTSEWIREVVSASPLTTRQDDNVLIVRATKKLLQRIGPPTLREGEDSTTLLGQWYATALPCHHISPDRELAALLRSFET